MRRVLMTLIGLSLFLPTLAEAAPLPQALSPYVQQTIERSERGIQMAMDQNSPMHFAEESLPSWLRQAFSGIASIVDTKSLIVDQGRSLLDSTSCRRFDDLLLELETEHVRQALHQAIDERRGSSILSLMTVLDFLKERRGVVAQGGNDPGLIDGGWSKKWFFDTAQIASSPPMCPFASDYLAPSLSGYGCDAETLALVQSRASGGDFARFQEVIAPELTALRTIQSSLTGPGAARTHQSMQGCLADSDMQKLETNAVFTPLKGPFSLETDNIRLLMQFQDLREEESLERPVPTYLQQNKRYVFLNGVAVQEAEKLQRFSQINARQEATSFAIGSDPLLSAEVSYKKLNDAVTEFGKLGSSLDGGLRGFVRDFAYFLRRTCMERPCNERLDRILKIVFQDACFPYTSGDYLNDTAAKPRWKICADAAGFLLP